MGSGRGKWNMRNAWEQISAEAATIEASFRSREHSNSDDQVDDDWENTQTISMALNGSDGSSGLAGLFRRWA